MKQQTKDRCTAIAGEIRELAFMAGKAKAPREYFYQIHTLAKEACDYFAFGFDAPPPKPAIQEAELEPVEYGFTCGEFDCPHDDSETEEQSFATMGEALDAAREHRATHKKPIQGIVTHEMVLA